MENNNVTTNNDRQMPNESKSNINSILVIIIIILVILLGVAGYFLFIKNEKGEVEQPNNSQIQETKTQQQDSENEETNTQPTTTPKEQTNETTGKLVAKEIYKSRDGKSSLTVNSIETKKDGELTWKVVHINYNGKKYTFEASDEDYKYNQYLVLDGDSDSGDGGQCFSAATILNLNTKTIEKFGDTGQPYYDVIKGNKGYFFTEDYCLSGYDTILYDNNWKKLGQLVGNEVDSQGNIYAFDNGKIKKYNSNGSKISETNTTAKYTGPGVIYNNTLYYMGEETGGVYLYNNDTGEKYKISDQSIDFKEGRYPYVGLDVEVFVRLSLENNKILINYDSDISNFSYDITTKQLTKIN